MKRYTSGKVPGSMLKGTLSSVEHAKKKSLLENYAHDACFYL